MRESDIEKLLVDGVKALGGVAEKFKSPGKKNVPDRVCSYPYGMVHWVELKKPGKKATAAQERDHQRRRAMGHKVYVVSSPDDVDWYLMYAKYDIHQLATGR